MYAGNVYWTQVKLEIEKKVLNIVAFVNSTDFLLAAGVSGWSSVCLSACYLTGWAALQHSFFSNQLWAERNMEKQLQSFAVKPLLGFTANIYTDK